MTYTNVPQPPAEKKRRRWPWVLLAIVVIVVIGSSLSQGGDSGAPTQDEVTDAFESLSPTVEYQVTGTATSAMVTYTTSSGMQQSVVSLPMMNKGGSQGISFTAELGTVVTISAQNQDDTGDVTCRILVDGEEISSNTSSGAYVIASCDGIVQ